MNILTRNYELIYCNSRNNLVSLYHKVNKMGGNALKSIKTVRLYSPEYRQISMEICNILTLGNIENQLVLCHENKESHGDIDIIVSTSMTPPDIREYITTTFEPNEIYHNGNCWSFDYRDVQIDFIMCSDGDFEAYSMFYNFGLGNFIGRLTHGFGLRYGQEGLFMTHYFKDTKHKVMVSKDYPKIYEFLGLDYRRWLKGFETLEEIFEFISESPYFNWQKFQPSELNRINRERNLKRASYMTFLEWMDENVADEDHEYEFEKDKSKYLSMIDRFFPEAGLLDELARIDYEVSKKKYVVTIFNGKIVMDAFGLKGGELGKALQGFKEYLEHRGVTDMGDYYIQSGTDKMVQEFENYRELVTSHM